MYHILTLQAIQATGQFTEFILVTRGLGDVNINKPTRITNSRGITPHKSQN